MKPETMFSFDFLKESHKLHCLFQNHFIEYIFHLSKKQTTVLMITKGGLCFALSFPSSSAASEASDGTLTKAHSGRDPERKHGFYL